MTLRFVPTPGDLAVFDTTPAQAATVLSRDEAAVETLGLRQVEGRFDFTDVLNAGLHSGTGRSLPEMASGLLMRFAAAERESWFTPLDWTVSVQWPRSGEQFHVAVPDLATDGIDVVGEPTAAVVAPVVPRGYQAEPYQVRVRLAGERFTITDRRVHAAYDEILAAFESGAVHYQAISEPLRIDHRRAWALGVADCVVAGRVLADRLRAEGMEARGRRGFLLGIVPNDHGYCEVLLDGRWRCLDPIFALLATKHAGDRAAEFRDACVGSRFNRLLPCAVDGSAPLFLRPDGTPAPTWAFSVSSRLNRVMTAERVTA
jgi:hypothetical protein